MKRPVSLMLCLALVAALPGRAAAGVNVERQSAENPMVEIFRSTLYGALTGAVVGGVIVLAAKEDADTNGDIMRWSIVGGTALGLVAGMYFTAKRPQPTGLLQFDDGAVSLHAALPELEPGGGMSMRLVAVRF